MKINVDIVVMDYDRTVANEDLGFKIDEEVKKILLRIPQRTILATGRIFEDIPDRDVVRLFDVLVVENGTILILDDGKKRGVLVGEAWLEKKRRVLEALREEGIDFNHGEVIIFGDRRDSKVLENALRKHDLLKEVFIDFNKDGYMILPLGWNKGKGVKFAVDKLGGGRVMCIGDEFNDIPLFEGANIRVAVGNAVPELKKMADIVCDEDNGRGVIEVLTNLVGVE